MNSVDKRLYRSKNNRTFAGVLGGFGDYFSVDPTILRVIFILLLLLTGVFPLVVFYILAIFIMPLDNSAKRD